METAEKPKYRTPETHVMDCAFDGKSYKYFGIHTNLAHIYGVKKEDIVKMEVSVAEDQTKPPPPQDDPNKDNDYWGWWDFERRKWDFIWPKHFLMNMCFTYGYKVEEDRDRGKAYRLNVKSV